MTEQDTSGMERFTRGEYQSYPEHLSESIRVTIGIDFLKRERRKDDNELRGDVWRIIDTSIETKAKDIRKFWREVSATEQKLGANPKMLACFLTAENIRWEEAKEISLDENLTAGATIGQLMPGNPSRPSAADVKNFFNLPENQTERDRQLAISKEEAEKSEPRDNFPIVVLEFKNGIRWVIDGNRRFIQSTLQGNQTVNAYVGRFVSEQEIPQNFWIDPSLLLQIATYSEFAESLGNGEVRNAAVSFLHACGALSINLLEDESTILAGRKYRASLGTDLKNLREADSPK